MDGTEGTEEGHDLAQRIYREEVADRGMFRLFSEQAWQLFLEK